MLTNVYAIGGGSKCPAVSTAGALVGWYNAGTITNGYWNTDVAAGLPGIGYNPNSLSTSGTAGLST